MLGRSTSYTLGFPASGESLSILGSYTPQRLLPLLQGLAVHDVLQIDKSVMSNRKVQAGEQGSTSLLLACFPLFARSRAEDRGGAALARNRLAAPVSTGLCGFHWPPLPGADPYSPP